MASKTHAKVDKKEPGRHSTPDTHFFIHVGHDNFVAALKVLSILNADSAPVKRSIHEAQKKGMVYDATLGRRTRSVILLEGGFLILSAFNPDTVAHRRGESEPR